MTIQFTTIDNYFPYVGESFGAAWGNVIENSPQPELWTVNHQSLASLFDAGRNSAQDVTQTFFRQRIPGDLHGSAWADFDNDGDQDLIQQVASDFGGSVNEFYVNENQVLSDQAESRGLADPIRGRTPLWLDYNGDGRLDLLLSGPSGNGVGPTVYRQNAAGEFINANTAANFSLQATRYAQLSDLTGDGIPEVLIDGGRQIFETVNGEFIDRTQNIFTDSAIRGARDAITADFNNDLQPDVWVTRRAGGSHTFEVDNRELRSYWNTSNNAPSVGLEWQSAGQVTFTLPFFRGAGVFIGGQLATPSDDTFTLDPNDIRLGGTTEPPPDGNGIYIDYNRGTQTWSIRLVGTNAPDSYGFIQTEQDIQSWQTIGFNNDSIERTNQLWINESGQLRDASVAAGLTADNAEISGRNAVAGDFDNDGDQDVYVLATGNAGNLDNKLYRNNGNGEFTVIENAWGATGTRLGLGDAATTVDINNDGFLDIVTVNGAFFNGTGNVSRAFYNDAPYELHLNNGNNNRWLLVDLEGRVTNRDGIGSSVIARARLNPQQDQAITSQLREQNGGIHNRAQNDSRLHFGLGQARRVDRLEINWLSGIRQTHFNVQSNQQLSIIEGQGTRGRDALSGRSAADNLVGLSGNDRLNGNGGNDRLNGGANRDLLVGGAGNDTLTGGAGRDRFSFRNFREGLDVITDFSRRDDVIQVQRQGFSETLSRGSLSAANFVLGSEARQNRPQFIYQASQGILSFDPDGRGGRAAQALVRIAGAPRLTASDIFVQ